MASDRRLEKIRNLLREELAKILDREVEFPEGTIVTITHVEISPDKHYGDVLISILGANPKGALETLKKNVYTIQQMLNRKVRMRPVPRIRFEIDKEEYRREQVEKSIGKLKREGEL